MKKTTTRSAALVITLGAVGTAAPAAAHHSFAMFDLSTHKLVEGRVTDWNYNNPHSWLIIEGLDANGEMTTWSFEGAAPVHAARQGVTGNTFSKGELVRVIMSPLRDGRNAGAVCFVVKEDGSLARPNDGICDSISVIDAWRAQGWLDSAKHLDAHPVDDSTVP